MAGTFVLILSGMKVPSVLSRITPQNSNFNTFGTLIRDNFDTKVSNRTKTKTKKTENKNTMFSFKNDEWWRENKPYKMLERVDEKLEDCVGEEYSIP